MLGIQERVLTILDYKMVRRVRTAAGARKYGQPIGSVIELDGPDVPLSRKPRTRTSTVRTSTRSVGAAKKPTSRVRSSGSNVFPGMKKASAQDRVRFKTVVGKPIPPAWTDVHIAENLKKAKLLARGKDVKGRSQFIYSAAHSAGQAEKKFARIKQLAKHLPKMDKAIQRDAMTNDDAAALMLIRKLGMRPGSDRDTGADKQAHGATNLLAKHIKVSGSTTKFDFTGKKGVHIQLETDDPLIAKVIKKRLATKKGSQRVFDTTEERTRAYMKSTGIPEGFLLKDLRTVRANVIALEEIEQYEGVPSTKTEFRRLRKEVAVVVSDQLGNTPALALSAYINPSVFAKWLQDESWA